MRIFLLAIVLGSGLASTLIGLAAEPAASRTSLEPGQPAAATPTTGQHRREGDRLDQQVGFFKHQEGRAVFVATDDNAEFSVLPNLNLERIERTLGDSPGRSLWKVSGTITEYRGDNWLLISRATRKLTPPVRTTLP